MPPTYEFDVHFIEKSGSPVQKASRRMTKEELLEWVQTHGTEVDFFDVFRLERSDASREQEGGT